MKNFKNHYDFLHLEEKGCYLKYGTDKNNSSTIDV